MSHWLNAQSNVALCAGCDVQRLLKNYSKRHRCSEAYSELFQASKMDFFFSEIVNEFQQFDRVLNTHLEVGNINLVFSLLTLRLIFPRED